MNLRDVTGYLRDQAVPRWRRWLLLAGVVYAAVPTDLVPDMIPVVGWLDDLGVIGGLTAFLIRDISKHAARKKSAPAIPAGTRGSPDTVA